MHLIVRIRMVRVILATIMALLALLPGPTVQTVSAAATWSQIGLAGLTVRTLVIHPTNPSILYAGTSNGVYKSTTGGTTWTAASSGLQNLDVRALVMVPSDPNTLYAGVYVNTNVPIGGSVSFVTVFKTTNGASTWFSPFGLGVVSLSDVNALAIDPNNSNAIYAATEGDGVYRSTNGGANWTEVGVRALGCSHVYALAVDTSSNPSKIYVGGSTSEAGAFKSTNGGSTWTSINNGLPTFSDVLTFAIHPASPATLYAGSTGGVFKSVNAGASWSGVNSGLPSSRANGIAIDPANPEIVYTGGAGGVFQSTNGGGTWTSYGTGLSPSSTYTLLLARTSPPTLYSGNSTNGVYKVTIEAQSVPCTGASGLNICMLQIGDILLEVPPSTFDYNVNRVAFASYWYHTAMYVGNNQIVEAAGRCCGGDIITPADEVRVRSILDSPFYTGNGYTAADWTVLRVSSQYQWTVSGAVAWAIGRAAETNGQPNARFIPTYEEFMNPANKTSDTSFYCSMLVWRAYYEASGHTLDLDAKNSGRSVFNFTIGTGLFVKFKDQVRPDDLFASAFISNAPLAVVADKDSSLARNVWALFSPGDLVLTDAQGRQSGVDPSTRVPFSNIPGAFVSARAYGADTEPEWISWKGQPGSVQLRVQGTGTGAYTLYTHGLVTSNTQAQQVQGTTTPGQVDTYSITTPVTGPIQIGPAPTTVDLAVELSSSPNPVALGGDIRLTAAVTNRGSTAATDPRITIVPGDVLGGGAPVVEAISTTWPGQIGGLDYVSIGSKVGIRPLLVGTLPPGGRFTFAFTTKATITGWMTSTADVISNSPETNTANNSASSQVQVPYPSQNTDFSVTLTGPSGTPRVGEDLTYVISVRNIGPASGQLEGITLTRDGLDFKVTDWPGMMSWSDSAKTELSLLGPVPMAPGERRTYRVVFNSGRPVTFTKTAKIMQPSTADPDYGNNTATTSTSVRPGNAGVVVAPAPAPASGGTALTATLTARTGCGSIIRIQFGTPGFAFDNARVTIASPSGGPSGQTSFFTYTPPAGTRSVSAVIQRVTPNGGATVNPVYLYDDCGEWRTFVGGGPKAF